MSRSVASSASTSSSLTRISGVSRAVRLTDLYPEKYRELRAFVDARKKDLRAMRREIAEWGSLLEMAQRHVRHEFAEGEPCIQAYFEDDVGVIEANIAALEEKRAACKKILADMAERVCNDLQALEYISTRRSRDLSRLEERLGAGYLKKNPDKMSHFVDRACELEEQLRDVRAAVRRESTL